MKEETPRQNSPAPKVLLIDDSQSILRSLKRAIESEGYSVSTAQSGDSAIERFQTFRPDIVLLDLNLNEESGWDVYEKLSRDSPETPVVVVTAVPNQYTMAQAAGVGALVEKPIEMDDLLAAIRRLLSEDVSTRLSRLVEHEPSTRFVPPNKDRSREP